jgi:hypothetical protein
MPDKKLREELERDDMMLEDDVIEEPMGEDALETEADPVDGEIRAEVDGALMAGEGMSRDAKIDEVIKSLESLKGKGGELGGMGGEGLSLEGMEPDEEYLI